MSLIKNLLPILEYDTESRAIIIPGHSTDFHFPERAVMLFMEMEVENYALENDCEIIGQFITVTKLFPVYKTIHNGVELAVCQAPLGGAAATQIMEQLIAGGVKKIIAQDVVERCSLTMKGIFIFLFLHYDRKEHPIIIYHRHEKCV